MKYKIGILMLLMWGFCRLNADAGNYELKSPDNHLTIKIMIGDKITYTVSYKGNEIILPSDISMSLESKTLGLFPQVEKVITNNINKVITRLYGKSSWLTDNYRELKIVFKSDFSLIFRAYNEGAAYRFVTSMQDSIKVIQEKAEFNLAGSPLAILPETHNLTSWELPYVSYPSSDLVPKNDTSIVPALFSYKKSGIKIVLAESDLMDYPGMYIQVDSSKIKGFWAHYPSKTVLGSWGNFVSVVKERSHFIALTKGKRTFPWRVMIITDDDKSLLANELIYKLASPSRIKNNSWIKPGKATWEWWSDALLRGADIPSGMENRTTALYKYYIDFAAKNHLEYLLIDAGWSNVYDVEKANPKIDIREVINYGKKKNVNVFLWCVATSLMNDLNRSLDYLKSLGAAGIKVDFFDRNDQQAINWYQEIARAAAQRELMINFHGCSEPAGLQKTYPNILNFEAVRGNECNKWDSTSNPNYHLLIPFIRMLGGPMDYTPGSMRNKSRATFKPIPHGLPYTQGTRCHELAMYVVFDQPLAMLCDSPTDYDKYPDIMKFLSAVPTVFDETKVLDAEVGKYALIAKRKDRNWYIGAMTNWNSRQIVIDFSFLSAGVTYQADIYTDTHESDKDAEKYEHQIKPVNRESKLKFNLASGGGTVIYLHF